MTIVPVRPGDLIRADDFNQVLAKVQDLEDRVARLESVNPTPGAVVIDDVSPVNPRVGDDVAITGRNFGLSIGATRIDFDGVPPNFLRAGSSDTLLICDVPAIPSLPLPGGPVTLTVRNQFSEASRQLIVTPATLPQSGGVDTLPDGADPATITAGQDNFLRLRLRSRARLGATISLTATVSEAAWQPTVQVLDAARQPLLPAQIHVESMEEKTFYVKVTIPLGTNGKAFTITVSGSGGGIATSSGPLNLVVGQPLDLDTTFTIAPSGSAPPGALTGMTITAASGAVTQVNLRGDFTTAGDYEVRLEPVGDATGWTLAVNDPAADASGKHMLSVLPAEIPAGGADHETIQFRVRPDSAGTARAQARLTVQRQGASTRQTLTFDLIAS